VTDGKHGVYVATKDMLYFHPAAQVKSVNTLGAGDAFGSCFVASILQGKKLEDAIRCGIINAGSVIMHHGAKTGLLSLTELNKSLEKLNKNTLKIFPF
jgi:sugar/nucleoside kinase (ribokinase family)